MGQMPDEKPEHVTGTIEAKDCRRAAERIGPWVRRTPLVESPFLSRQNGARVLLKLENHQITGSFKARGAVSKILSLSAEERARGVVAASSGNHGLGVAYGAGCLGIDGEVFLPEATSAMTRDAIRDHGARISIHGDDCLETENAARSAAESSGRAYISPYNDPDVVAGQGSIGVELAEDLDSLAAVYVAVGGGGLISGGGVAVKDAFPGARVIGCSPERSCVLHESVAAGRILDIESSRTLSHSTAGGVEEGAITFDMCREIVDDWRLVSEAEIAAAMRIFIDREHMLIEGAAGVAVAGCLREQQRFAGGVVVVVICGANVGSEELREVLTTGRSADASSENRGEER